MAGYKPPKQRLHREFLYLNHDAILNSLSALEAGEVDEILQKISDAREGGGEASVGAGPVRAKGGRKKSSNVEEQLVRTRTRFSAFEAWDRQLTEAEAYGTFDVWDDDVRNAIRVGDTLKFDARIELSPIYKVFQTFLSFADSAAKPGNAFSQTAQELKETKATATMMRGWIGSQGKPANSLVYLSPGGVREPRMVSVLQPQYVVGSGESLEGEFSIVGQVAALLDEGESLSAIRVVRDVPPTPMELATVTIMLEGFKEPAAELGVEVDDADINIVAPAVIIRAIAIYQ